MMFLFKINRDRGRYEEVENSNLTLCVAIIDIIFGSNQASGWRDEVLFELDDKHTEGCLTIQPAFSSDTTMLHVTYGEFKEVVGFPRRTACQIHELSQPGEPLYFRVTLI